MAMGEKKTRFKSGDDKIRVLSSFEVDSLVEAAEATRYPIRNRAIVLLAVEGGLTPLEISYLKRRHILGDDGFLGEEIDLRSKPSKYLKPRVIPMSRKGRLWGSLQSLLENAPATPEDPLIISERACDGGGATKNPGTKDLRSMRATSISYIFWKVMDKAGVAGASAATARTTFIIRAGRSANRNEVSLRNVQDLTGQRSLESVQRLLEADEKQRKVIIEDMFDD